MTRLDGALVGGGHRRILYIAHDMSSNALGRAYSLWLVSEHLGWSALVLSLSGSVWPTLRATKFSESCVVAGSLGAFMDQVKAFRPDVLLAIKPHDESFGVGRYVSDRLGIPLLLDIDDPDLDHWLTWEHPIRRLAKEATMNSKHRARKRTRALAQSVETLVSNPYLARIYGGGLVPHVRADAGPGLPHERDRPVVAFVGTTAPHKGLHLLRAAVRFLSNDGFSLVVTADAPADAAPHETWLGRTTLEDGLALLGRSDIVVLPSLRGGFARGQLPVKLIDAMMFGRAVAVSAVDPMPWALGGAGLVFHPGSVKEVVRALQQMRSPRRRAEMGAYARRVALARYTPRANALEFSSAVQRAVARR